MSYDTRRDLNEIFRKEEIASLDRELKAGQEADRKAWEKANKPGLGKRVLGKLLGINFTPVRPLDHAEKTAANTWKVHDRDVAYGTFAHRDLWEEHQAKHPQHAPDSFSHYDQTGHALVESVSLNGKKVKVRIPPPPATMDEFRPDPGRLYGPKGKTRESLAPQPPSAEMIKQRQDEDERFNF